MNLLERETLIGFVKNIGQELIDNAEEYVGSTNELLTDFDIWLRFRKDELPKIDISKSYESEKSIHHLFSNLTKV